MKPRRLLWQLYSLQLLITITALLAVTWYVSESIREFHLGQTARGLEARARLIEGQVAVYLRESADNQLLAFCRQAGKSSSTRFTVINPSGLVLADSMKDPRRMDNHAGRPEVIAAISGRSASAVRFSHTLQEKMMYVAIPVKLTTDKIYVLRASTPVTAIDNALEAIYLKIIIVVIIVALFAALGAGVSSRHISRPLEIIKKGAERFAAGDFSRRLDLPGSSIEITGLFTSLNKMAGQLNDRITAVLRQRNELEAIFAGMIEGVFVFDIHERFVSMNKAGAEIVGADPTDIKGKSLLEVIRSSDLLGFVQKTLAAGDLVEDEIILNVAGGEFFFMAHGVPLRDASGQASGGLIVVNDVTRLRRLEKIRRDFVANVSHELRTPITSIKGFVETLRDGAIDEPEHAKKFLEIIFQQTSRLNAIIDDLLTLSRLEQQTDKKQIKLRRQAVADPIQAAIKACETRANKKGVTLDRKADQNLQAALNSPLLEEALVNLIDNAIKYSPPKSKVFVNARVENKAVCIDVIDNGPGISREHLPRLFERFYQVDPSRSKKTGGSGLGLAIAKNIVMAHNGKMTVQSTVGKGSTFTISLPSG